MAAKHSIAPASQVKLDVGKALMLRLTRGLTYAEIGAKFGCTKQAVQTALSKYSAIIDNPIDLKTYQRNKADILESILQVISFDLLDPDKRHAASLNNLAYAFTQLNNAIRLERGQSSANSALVIHIDYGDGSGSRTPTAAVSSTPTLPVTELQPLVSSELLDIPNQIDQGTLCETDPPTPDHLDTSTSLNYNIPFPDVDLVKGGD